MRQFLSYFVRYTRNKKMFAIVIGATTLIFLIILNLTMFSYGGDVEVVSDPKGSKGTFDRLTSLLPGSSSKITDDDKAQISDNRHTIFDTAEHKSYLTDLFTELIAVQPDFDSLPSSYPKAPEMAPWDDHPVLSYNHLSEKYLKVTDHQVNNLKEKHAEFLAKILNKKSKVHFANHGDDQEHFYIENSNGIVYVGGGRYSWFALLSIKHLRSIGSKLPIEVYIPFEEEYEKEFCEVILPSMNAKCLKIYEILDLEVLKDSKFKIQGFMLKSLAILLSNFENILLLDADNMPYLNPDILFVSEPYQTYKFVVWPDYWERTTHPKFYEIQGLDLITENLKLKDPNTGQPKYSSAEQIKSEVPLHDLKGTIPNPSTESGQLLISKKAHADAILLSLYYNMYGPNYYYHLITQWAPGQGDKDTFLAAANLLNSTYYQIKTTVKAIGYHKSNGEFRGTAQGQYSPIDEYNFKTYHKKLLAMYEEDFCMQKGITKKQLEQSKTLQEELEEYQKIQIETLTQFSGEEDEDKALKDYYANVFDLPIKLMFVHESTPKFDPLDLILNNQITNEENTERIRFYDNVLTDPGYYSFEKMQWQYIYDLLCGSEDERVHMEFISKQIENFGDRYDEEKFCQAIQDEIDWIGSR
ncbi:hypothetical protein DASC09_047540 [Saccharomycopsis crataegensis]|uniref:Alpha-1,2-mannosyltransferase n=1 Tax=Saccharomycopsis crataegensis TaxID=43959 RepID=A0AAV5QRR0_9ASCO|nr:hypothetical protein DASC09_047540 [Saccharomycopsis crataegensis]